MKLKRNLQLRRIGSRHMIVDTGDTVNLTNVFTLNETAARLWKLAEEKDFTADELADLLGGEYAVDRETVLKDVKRQIDEWQAFGLVEP